MAVISVPSALNFETAKITLERSSVSFRSPWTGKRKVIAQPYAVWRVEARATKVDGADAASIRGFLINAQGRQNTFQIPMSLLGYTAPSSGYAGTTGQVMGAGQTGSSLVTDNWTPSTLVLKAGDYFNVGGEMKMVTQDITSNVSGVATVTFQPSLRAAPADNAALDYTTPYVVLAMSEDDAGSWSLSAPVIHQIDLKMEEAF